MLVILEMLVQDLYSKNYTARPAKAQNQQHALLMSQILLHPLTMLHTNHHAQKRIKSSAGFSCFKRLCKLSLHTRHSVTNRSALTAECAVCASNACACARSHHLLHVASRAKVRRERSKLWTSLAPMQALTVHDRECEGRKKCEDDVLLGLRC